MEGYTKKEKKLVREYEGQTGKQKGSNTDFVISKLNQGGKLVLRRASDDELFNVTARVSKEIKDKYPNLKQKQIINIGAFTYMADLVQYNTEFNHNYSRVKLKKTIIWAIKVNVE